MKLQIILVVGFGGAVGVIGGGLLGQLFYNRRKHSMPIFIGELLVKFALSSTTA